MKSNELFRKFEEDTRIWKTAQFTVEDVCQIADISKKALEHFLDPKRGMVNITGQSANPGKGRRRLFCGDDVLKISSAYHMNRIGFPQRWSIMMTDEVVRRANAREIGLSDKTDMTIATYPDDDGDWAVVPMYAETEVQPEFPPAVQILQVDVLIDQTKIQLQAIVAGEEIPDFKILPPPPYKNPYSPASNFFRMWQKDEHGNWLYVGLSLEETTELMALTGVSLNGDEIVHEHDALSRHKTPEQADRYLALQEKHELARIKIVGDIVPGK